MILAKVLGTVVSTRKDAGLSGLKLLLAREVDGGFQPAGNQVVAVDADEVDGRDVYLKYAAAAAAAVADAAEER